MYWDVLAILQDAKGNPAGEAFLCMKYAYRLFLSFFYHRHYKGEDGCIEIRDLDSTNGTYINGEKLDPNEKRRVQRGDEVRFGNVEYEYR